MSSDIQEVDGVVSDDDMTVDELRAELHAVRADFKIAASTLDTLVQAADRLDVVDHPEARGFKQDVLCAVAVTLLTMREVDESTRQKVVDDLPVVFNQTDIAGLMKIADIMRGWYDVPSS